MWLIRRRWRRGSRADAMSDGREEREEQERLRELERWQEREDRLNRDRAEDRDLWEREREDS